MRTSKTSAGPFAERPYYDDADLEAIAADELRRVSLLPASPGPIRIERFIEKRFGAIPRYEDLEPGILGYSRFGRRGVEEVVVSRALAEEGTRVAERRINSTLAHEAGHMLLHGHLFALEADSRPTLLDDVDLRQRTILCRDDGGGGSYDGRWWEYQANRMIGALLMPRALVSAALRDLVKGGVLGVGVIPADRRPEALELLGDAFQVNQPVARLRLEEIFPGSQASQLTF